MAKITINEQDLTMPSGIIDTTDIPFVLGFTGVVAIDKKPATGANKDTYYYTYESDSSGTLKLYKGDSELSGTNIPEYYYRTDSKNEPTAVFICSPNTPEDPILCESISAFEYYFGTSPWVFQENVPYPTTGGKPLFSDKTYTGDNANMYMQNDLERSYIYAKELINLGMPVLYYSVNRFNEEPDISKLYASLKSDSTGTATTEAVIDKLKDKGEYNFKYFTTGGYPSFEVGNNDILTSCIDLCEGRGDAIVLVDHTNLKNRPVLSTNDNSVFAQINKLDAINTNGIYGAMFTPWGWHSCSTVGETICMPASFAYLKSLATSIKTNNSWLTTAGVSRGVVPGLVSLNTEKKLTNAIADSYQTKSGKSINAITYIKPYGYCVWGNRTLKNNVGALSATSFLNLRNLISDVKKTAYSAAVKLMFEHNTDILWSRFRAELTPMLDQMVTGYGLETYEIKRIDSAEHGKLEAQIKLYPVYAVEEFEVMVTMQNQEVTVE